MDRNVFEKLNYGLYIAAVAEEGRNYGCLISSFSQITSGNPRKCAVILNRDNRTCDALLKTGTLAVSMVGQDADKELLKTFGYKSGRTVDKFAGLNFRQDAAGNPYLTDNMAAWVSLKVTETVPVKNYYLFICDAVEGEVLSDARLMTMDEFLQKGFFAPPPTATVYRTMAEDEGWICPICGYHYTGEVIPEGYICPLCRCPGEKFEKKKA